MMVNKRSMVLLITVNISVIISCNLAFGEEEKLIYPGETWLKYVNPEEAGFSLEKLAKAKEFNEKIGSAAVLVIYDGVVLVSWGDVDRRYMCHSIRKSFMSALYGIYVDNRKINLDKNLADLGITENGRLSEEERTARISDLLKARSGVYIPAAYETESMKAIRPERGTFVPGINWYYNNWDFNVLGTIFEQETGKKIFEEFMEKIAVPLQMQDYRVMDGYYHYETEKSIYPAYLFKMSARDMARFGLLYLRKGQWSGQKIIPESWIDESTKPYSYTFDPLLVGTFCLIPCEPTKFFVEDLEGELEFKDKEMVIHYNNTKLFAKKTR